jgi:hypothetical protein
VANDELYARSGNFGLLAVSNGKLCSETVWLQKNFFLENHLLLAEVTVCGVNFCTNWGNFISLKEML